jgi:hypothetical protein
LSELAGNERGIPKAPFVDVVENFSAGSDAENLMRKVINTVIIQSKI